MEKREIAEHFAECASHPGTTKPNAGVLRVGIPRSLVEGLKGARLEGEAWKEVIW